MFYDELSGSKRESPCIGRGIGSSRGSVQRHGSLQCGGHPLSGDYWLRSREIMRDKTTRRARWAAVAGGAVCAVLLVAPGASASTTAGWGDELIQLDPGGQQSQGWGDELIDGRGGAVAGGAVCAVRLVAPGAAASSTAGWGDELIQLDSGSQQAQGWGDELMNGWGDELINGWGDELINGWGDELINGWGDELINSGGYQANGRAGRPSRRAGACRPARSGP